MCSSRLRVKNKNVNSAIGGVGGGLGGGLGAFLTISWLLTGNVLYLGLLAILLTTGCIIPLLIANKYVKVELEAGSKSVVPITYS